MNTSLLVISSFPEKGKTHDPSVGGGASYTKNTLRAMQNAAIQQKESLKITVLAEKTSDNSTEYDENGMTVKRIWKRNSLFSFWSIGKEILLHHKADKHIMIAFEFAMYGEGLAIIPLPFLIVFMRLFGKQVTFIMHQVLIDINSLSNHVNIKKYSAKAVFFSKCLKLYYASILLTANSVIVFDNELKNRLASFGHGNKISVIHHGVEKAPTPIVKNEARKQLNIPQNAFVLLSFGFLAWYKGSDWLVKTIAHMKQSKQSKLLLIMAGGSVSTRLDKPYYKKYVKQIESICRKHSIRLTGYIPQEQIGTYFSAADIVIIPYRTFMSASGPFSYVQTYKKPFLLSDNISAVLNASDMQSIFTELQLVKNDFLFPLSKKSIQIFDRLRQNKKKLAQLEAFSTALFHKRSWDTIGTQYYYFHRVQIGTPELLTQPIIPALNLP